MRTVARAWAAALLASAPWVFSAAAGEGSHDHRVHGAAASSFQREMDAGMARMMQDMHAPGYTGDPDVDFLAMMIPHHEGAVEMARLLLIYGRDPATRRLAEDIIASQQVEIDGMRRRLKALRSGDRGDGFPALGGTRGERARE